MVLGIGSWGTSTIQSYAPDQAGKWRVTAPPLGLKVWYSDTKLAIMPKQIQEMGMAVC